MKFTFVKMHNHIKTGDYYRSCKNCLTEVCPDCGYKLCVICWEPICGTCDKYKGLCFVCDFLIRKTTTKYQTSN